MSIHRLAALALASAAAAEDFAGQAAVRVAAAGAVQKTRQGCTCTTPCGATVTVGLAKYDWCYTQDGCGTSSLEGAWDYCVYPVNGAYEAQEAGVKAAQIWNAINANHTSGTYPAGADLGKVFLESVATSFLNHADEMPQGRVKYIHSVGFSGFVDWAPVAGTPYTGVFAAASPHVLMRFSSAKLPTKGSITPGFGIKFFRDGRESANFMSMPSLDGQADFNFFALNFTNHPARPHGLALEALAKKFEQASNCPLNVGLSDAATDAVGATPRFPYELVFQPTGKVAFPSTYYDMETLQDLFSKVAVGTPLFEVYAHDTPAAKKAGVPPTLVATVTSNTRFVPSRFADDALFFRHQWMEADFALRPEWLEQIDPDQDCGTKKVTTTAPGEACPHELPQGREATYHDCPFAKQFAQ